MRLPPEPERQLMYQKFLMLDPRTIENAQNAQIKLGKVKKYLNNPLFGEDKPWEVRFDNLYANVWYNPVRFIGKPFRLWYNPFIVDHSTSDTPEEEKLPGNYREFLREMSIKFGREHRVMGVCYAESEDGIHWEKPNLGIYSHKDSKDTNIVAKKFHGAGMYFDPFPEDSQQRYKLIFRLDKEDSFFYAMSEDGIRWGGPIEIEGFKNYQLKTANSIAYWRGDTHNNIFFDIFLSKYVVYTRMWKKFQKSLKWESHRVVGRSESADFIHFTKPEVVLEELESHLEPYSMVVFPYTNLFLGLVAIFNTQTDRVSTELALSLDNKSWERINPGQSLIPNDSEEGAYDWGCIYAANRPFIIKDDIWIYYLGSDGLHTDWRKGYFCLATLRIDGFAGFEQIDPNQDSIITTPIIKTIPNTWCGLQINADVDTGGYIDIKILDNNNDILDVVPRITDTCINYRIQLVDPNINVKKVKVAVSYVGKQIKIQFIFRKAKIYSFDLESTPMFVQ